MLEDRVKFALDNFLNPEYISVAKSSYDLIEKDEQGKSLLVLQVNTEDNICVMNYDKVPPWAFISNDSRLNMRKCIDHFILRKYNGHWELHMIEMKTAVGFKTLNNIKSKVRASYLNIQALTTILGISLKTENVFVYTTYGEDKINQANTDEYERIPHRVGNRAFDAKKDEWNADCIYISIVNSEGYEEPVKFSHKKIKMKRSRDGKLLKGESTLQNQ